MASSLVHIDGSYLEGGGQILRNAAALSCITKVPVHVDKIRAGRSNPGLRPQHLMGLQLLSDMCGGRLEGGHVGSTEITLTPKNIHGGKYTADTKTAGSVCLLVQAALPCQFFASGSSSELQLKGGTNADMAPQIDYFINILQPLLSGLELKIKCDVIRRGYFPKGGGEVIVRCPPVREIPPIILTEEGQLVSVTGTAFVAGVLPLKVAQNMARFAHNLLTKHLGRSVPIHIEALKEPEHKAFGTGCGINIFAETSTGCRLAGSALGRKGVPAEKVGENAAEELLKSITQKVCVDEYMQDQLIIFMALAKGHSEVKCGPITQHTETSIHVAQSLTKAHFEVKKLSQDTNLITCEGVGWQNQNL